MQTPHKILVVDDADDSRRLAVYVLERADFAVIEAATGASALQLAGTSGPDVIVLDVHLPDLDGFEICRRLKGEPNTRPIPVLFLSATYTGLDARVRGIESGAQGYLTKPYEPTELVSAVTNLLRLSQAEAALRIRDSLLAIGRAVGGMVDLTEALRIVCRELARLTGAETVGAYLRDREDDVLRPVAGYRIPKDALDLLAGSPVPSPPFWSAVVRAGEVVWTDAVSHDARFDLELFRALPHQSSAVIPLVVDGDVAGMFYLVWWKERRRVDPPEAAMLQTVGQQVGLLLRNARLIEQAESRRRLAETARQHYQLLFERSFVGIFRARADGTLLQCNDAFARLLGYGSAAEAHGQSMRGHYATPADRDLVVAKLAAGEDVLEAELIGRRCDGSLVPVALSVRRVVDPDGMVHEGILMDLTDRKRAEEAAALRSVTELANAAAHEINNPLTVILGQLELMQRGRDIAEGIERAQAAVVRINDIVSHMLRITRLEPSTAWSSSLPRMLDLRRSGPEPPEGAPRPPGDGGTARPG